LSGDFDILSEKKKIIKNYIYEMHLYKSLQLKFLIQYYFYVFLFV